MAENWEAKGTSVFQGGDCIGIFDTGNGETRELERRAALAAAAPRLRAALAAIEAITQHSRLLVDVIGFQNTQAIRKLLAETKGK